MAKMTNQQLIDTFNQYVKDWLNDDAEDSFVLDGVEFELIWDGSLMRVLCEGVEVAATDCRRDFMKIGTYLLETI